MSCIVILSHIDKYGPAIWPVGIPSHSFHSIHSGQHSFPIANNKAAMYRHRCMDGAILSLSESHLGISNICVCACVDGPGAIVKKGTSSGTRDANSDARRPAQTQQPSQWPLMAFFHMYSFFFPGVNAKTESKQECTNILRTYVHSFISMYAGRERIYA